VQPDLEDTVVPGDGRKPSTAVVEARAPVEPPVAFYGFRVGGSSRTVMLDAAAYVGRAPAPPRIRQGARPRLIRVPSPLGEVSATHLQLEQLGTSVVVTDLRSTNGTRVSVPGRPPHALRPGEAIVVGPGTLVDIGDGNVIEILPLQRRPGGPHV
jgi:hypothetical protein